jgi:hypothetical protein
MVTVPFAQAHMSTEWQSQAPTHPSTNHSSLLLEDLRVSIKKKPLEFTVIPTPTISSSLVLMVLLSLL